MSVKETLQNDIKTAMKAKNKEELEVLRFLSAAVKQKEIDGKVELGDEEVFSIIQSQLKRRKESISQFEKGGRDDLVAKEKKGVEIIERYLPEALSEEELKAIVEAAVKETGASSPQDMGKVMKAVMPKTGGRADGKVINQLVRGFLS